MATWVENVIARLESSAGGVMEKENKAVLVRMGVDMFREFVMLLSEKREEEAFDLIAAQMEADDIIAKINMTADELRDHNDARDRFETALQKFAISLLTGAASKILLGLLL